jgi:hypothetical protein
MSFEGTEHFICEKGHYDWQDCYCGTPDKCVICGSKIVWSYTQDETNGVDEDDPINTLENFLREASVTEECKLISIKDGTCYGTRMIEVKKAIYNIPTTFGHKIE